MGRLVPGRIVNVVPYLCFDFGALLVGDLSEGASLDFLTILPSSSFMSSAAALLTAGLFLPSVIALGITGTPLLSSYEGLPQSSEFDSGSLSEAIFESISNIFFCKMLRSVA